MRTVALATIAIASLTAQAASAFDLNTPTSFRGFRVEGNIGGDQFRSEGTHKNRFGFGGTAGFDGLIGDQIVVGAEGTFWRARHGNHNVTGGPSGTIFHESLNEYGAAFRAGYLITPKILLFAKGGYVNNRQHMTFAPTSTLFYVNGTIVRPGSAYDRRFSTDGYQMGGGAEYSLTDMFYVDAQYVYSNYGDQTLRHRVLVGGGIRFK